MMPDAKYPEIASGLLEKTKNGSARWHGNDSPRSYSLRLPASRILLSFVSPRTEFDQIVMQLCKPDGTVVVIPRRDLL